MRDPAIPKKRAHCPRGYESRVVDTGREDSGDAEREHWG